MIHWLIHEVLFNFVFIGFVVWKVGRMWLYPNMDKLLNNEYSLVRTRITRLLIIGKHSFRHQSNSAFTCQEDGCVVFSL